MQSIVYWGPQSPDLWGRPQYN